MSNQTDDEHNVPRSEQHVRSRVARRQFLKLGAGAAIVASAAGSARLVQAIAGDPDGPTAHLDAVPAASTPRFFRLGATDGFVSYPTRRTGPAYPEDLGDFAEGVYAFGFRGPTPNDLAGGNPFTASIGELVGLYKGRTTHPSPILAVDEDDDVYIKMTNLGFEMRPDLDDAHTVHWHGFRHQIALFDGVPEASISVPPLRDFPYYFLPHDAGTYIYHCHFEDTEHVQMGMTGIVFVRPSQDRTPLNPGERYAYNDGDGSTRFHREFTLLLNEVDVTPHDNLVAVQEFVWSEYDAQYYVINGRCYPDTVLPDVTPELPLQQISALVQANAGERVLLRLANLGYYQHSMQLAGIAMRVVGADATLLRGPAPLHADLSYLTNTIDCGPGESRDAIFVAPPHSGSPGPDVYLFKNRNVDRIVNGTDPSHPEYVAANGLGGMVTEVHVHPPGTLPPQTGPNELLTP